MPATDYQGSSDPFASFGRSILSFRRDQVHATDGHHDPGSTHDLEIEVFQKHVADLFFDLASSSSSSDGSGSSTPSASAVADDVLSLSWLRKLLDTFLICLEEFRVILFNCGKGQQLLTRPSLDHYVSDFFDRAVKALDVCNAIRDGINQLRQWRLHLEIVLTALSPGNKALGEGQLHRARKALVDLTILMLDEKESGGSVINNRNRSFGRAGKVPHHRRSGSGGARGTSAGHYRSLSWSVSRTWSAARQLQAIGNNLSAPRASEVTATNGLAVPIFTMSSVLLFVMSTLVAAIPCQDRGLQTHFSVPRTFPWAAPAIALHERIFEGSKRKDRKNSCGLLKEILQIEKCTRQLAELLDTVEFPISEEKEIELKQGVEELVEVCDALEELDQLERQVREVFHRIIKSRTEGLDSLSRSHNME